MSAPKLVATRVPEIPQGIVLVLHGGAGRRGNPMVRPTQLSVLRMIPIAWLIAFRSRGRVAVFRLLNSSRGWNVQHTPVMDVELALAHLEERFGPLPVALVGHSLGGRAALLAGSGPAVTGVVALNAYLHPRDGSVDLRGKEVHFVHGTRDRVAPLHVVETVVRQLRRKAPVELVPVEGGKHAMLRRFRTFDRLAADFALAALRVGVGRDRTGTG